MQVSPDEGYRLWAETYDAWPNPLVALEERYLAHAPGLNATHFLDAATGTGRWLKRALARGADAWGLDRSPGMLAVAGRSTNRLIQADLRAIPFADNTFDTALCSLALGYLQDPGLALHELSRVARRVIVTELHPAAVAAGWTRSFRVGDERCEITHYPHAFADFGYACDWFVEAAFGEPERPIFEAAGKPFDTLPPIPALYLASWTTS